MEITADGIVNADNATVFAFLSDLRNHWQLTGRWVKVLDLTGPGADPTGGWVELRGPVGLRRRLRTTVVELDAPRRIDGLAELAPRTRARVSWTLEPRGAEQTSVRLHATVVTSSRLHRLVLVLGARRWLARRFQATLAQLSSALAGQHAGERPELVEHALRARVLEDPFAL